MTEKSGEATVRTRHSNTRSPMARRSSTAKRGPMATGSPYRRRSVLRSLGAAAAAGAVLLTAACGAGAKSSALGPHGEGIGVGAGGPPTSAPTTSAPVKPCGPESTAQTWSGPLPQPGRMPAGSTMDRVKARGYLIAGIDLSTWLFGYDPHHTNTPQGFDVDIAKQISKAIFGDTDHIQFKVVTLADRVSGEIPALNGTSGGAAPTVDVVVRTTTITCTRVQALNFSNPYYLAKQLVLVPKDPATVNESLTDLKGKKVCATVNSTAFDLIAKTIGPTSAYPAANALDCLVLLQEDKVDAVSTDDAILQGMVAQDPQVQITSAKSLGEQPYGIVTAKAKNDLAQFVNGVLAQIEADGTWSSLYQADLGRPAPTPPGVPQSYAIG